MYDACEAQDDSMYGKEQVIKFNWCRSKWVTLVILVFDAWDAKKANVVDHVAGMPQRVVGQVIEVKTYNTVRQATRNFLL